MTDVIRLVGMSFYGYHGVSAAEKETGRAFEVDCEIEADLARAGHSDRLADTIDYGAVYATIREVVEGKAYALLERLAGELAALLLDRFPIFRVTLKVRKMMPPVSGQVKHIEVEVTRHQGDVAKITDEDNQPQE
ncbi:MAG: dihydroneopterin aldolase [candidate division Zixibacteria bacterium]|nr:dihydroneopterin aldolase [candidate division Zixibacteria bacterium]